MKLLVDPLARNVDLSIDASDPDTVTFASYALWFGWQYQPNNAPAQPGMLKVGDRFGWGRRSFGLLVTDLNVLWPDRPLAQASHPDGDDMLGAVEVENGPNPWYGQSLPPLVPGNKISWSTWVNFFSASKGSMDMNFGSDDGSVSRLVGVGDLDDVRVTPIPYTKKGNRGDSCFVPKG